MVSLANQSPTLGTLLDETRGVVGGVLGTAEGELCNTVGSVADGNTSALIAAALANELGKAGSALGLGAFDVVTLKASSAARVVARQAGAILALELDPKKPLGELETKLRTLPWAPPPELLREPEQVQELELDDDSAVPYDDVVDDWSEEPAVARESTRPNLEQQSNRYYMPPQMLGMGGELGSSTGVPEVVPERASRPTAKPGPNNVPSPMTTVGSGPVFTGDLEEFALPDLLEFMRNSHRTGLLVCTSDAGTGTVHMSRGMVVSADSPHALDLRAHFVSRTDMHPELRRQLAALPHEFFSDDMIDSVLVSRELVPREELERARIARIHSAFREMITWTSGRFSFDPAVPIVSNPAVALSARSILMQIYQEMDDQNPGAALPPMPAHGDSF